MLAALVLRREDLPEVSDYDWWRAIPHNLPEGASLFLLEARRVHGTVRRDFFLSLSRVVIDHKGIACPPARRSDRRGHAVEIRVGDFKENRSIEHRLYHNFAAGARLIPQFQLTTVLMLPVFIKVRNHSQPTRQASLIGGIPVSMNVELTSTGQDVVSGTL